MPNDLVTDASCLLTLVASGRALDLAEALDLRLITTTRAVEETAALGTATLDEVTNREVLTELQARQRLATSALEDGDLDLLVRCAEHLPDDDAAVLALARKRGATLASDDSCQRRVASVLFPDLALTSTPALVADAFEALGLEPADRQALLTDVQTRGRFLPARNDPLRDWFLNRSAEPATVAEPID